MPASAPKPERSPEPIRLDDHAASQIRFIRDTMEGASTFTSISGWGMVGMGATASLAAWIAARQATPESWLVVWVAEAVVALGISIVLSGMKARKLDMTLFSKPGRKFVFGLLPPLVAGAVLTGVLFVWGYYHLIPGMLLLLYGAGLATGGAFSVKIVPFAGASFMATGLVGLIAFHGWPNVVLAAGFGGLHLLFGAWIAWRHGG